MVRAGILQISEQKLYRNLIRSGGINRCGYQQKVKRAILRKFLISDTPLSKNDHTIKLNLGRKEEEKGMVVDRLRTDLLNKLINARIDLAAYLQLRKAKGYMSVSESDTLRDNFLN